MLTRRRLMQGGAVVALAVAAFGGAWFFGHSAPQLVDSADAQRVSDAELLQPNPLGEMTLGPANARVTVIEYASATCSHCAHFAVTTFPEFKKRYIDTGKVRFIFREFPLDPLAAAAFMLARCAAKEDTDKYFALVDTLFHQQDKWAFVQKPLEPLKGIAKQAGLSDQDFDSCLANQPMLEKIETLRRRANEKLGVSSTPTFFINGEKLSGALTLEQLSKAVDPYLKAG